MAILGQIWPYIIIYGLGSEAKGIAKPYFSTLCWKKGVPNVEKKHIWPHLSVQMHRHNDLKTCWSRMIKKICVFGVAGIYTSFYLRQMRSENVWEEFVRPVLHEMIGSPYLVWHLDGSTDIEIDTSHTLELSRNYDRDLQPPLFYGLIHLEK